ncbi:MAG: hypothetical protein L6Q47_04920 [Ignavibacteriaceae bacterium]|nr:hypothetical protein [Ignavibacteriaceae bacterium]
MKQILYLQCILILASLPLTAQTEITMRDYAEDETGRRLVYYLKESFNTSSSFKLLTFIPKDRAVMVIEVNTMDKNAGDKSNEGLSTIYSIVWYIKAPDQPWGFYLNSTMGFSGKNRIKESAVDIVASTKKMIDDISKYLNE